LPWLLVLLSTPLVVGFCPKGFGPGGNFPDAWNIPTSPQNMPMEDLAKLRTITLGGFTTADLNEEYLEGPNDEYVMQGQPTFWQASGAYFMYLCSQYSKWRIAAISAFSDNKNGKCFAFVSDAYQNRDILNASLIKGWIEVEEGQWAVREDAGTVAVGTLGDQMGMDDTEEEEEQSGDCAEDDPLNPKKDKSNCPVMPHVRKAKAKVVQVAKDVGKWAKRLMPTFLAAPDEEDAIPDDGNPLFPTDGSCTVAKPDTCGFKQKFYIKKQEDRTSTERQDELQRLVKLENVAMKDTAKNWLDFRVAILRQFVTRDGGTEEM